MNLPILAAFVGLGLVALGAYGGWFIRGPRCIPAVPHAWRALCAALGIALLALGSVTLFLRAAAERERLSIAEVECEVARNSAQLNASPPTTPRPTTSDCLQRFPEAAQSRPVASGPTQFTVSNVLGGDQITESITVVVNGSLVGTGTVDANTPASVISGSVSKPGAYDYQLSGYTRLQRAPTQEVRIYGTGTIQIEHGVQLILVLHSLGKTDARVAMAPLPK